MKVTTLNMQGFIHWDAREPYVTEYLKKEAPDIIFFQEVVFLPDISAYNQAQRVNQVLGYPFELSVVSRLQPSHQYETFREGMAVLSKHPIVSSDTIVLKKHERDEHNRLIQFFDIKVGADIVKFANVHLSITDNEDFATPQLQEVLDILKQRGEKRIMIGDFNMTYLETTRELWQDAYEATTVSDYITYPTMDKRVDYLLLPKRYSFEAITTSGDGLSDHRALTVAFKQS